MEAYRTRKGNILEARILKDNGKGLLTWQFLLREKIGENENITLIGKYKLIDPTATIRRLVQAN